MKNVIFTQRKPVVVGDATTIREEVVPVDISAIIAGAMTPTKYEPIPWEPQVIHGKVVSPSIVIISNIFEIITKGMAVEKIDSLDFWNDVEGWFIANTTSEQELTPHNSRGVCIVLYRSVYDTTNGRVEIPKLDRPAYPWSGFIRERDSNDPGGKMVKYKTPIVPGTLFVDEDYNVYELAE